MHTLRHACVAMIMWLKSSNSTYNETHRWREASMLDCMAVRQAAVIRIRHAWQTGWLLARVTHISSYVPIQCTQGIQLVCCSIRSWLVWWASQLHWLSPCCSCLCRYHMALHKQAEMHSTIHCLGRNVHSCKQSVPGGSCMATKLVLQPGNKAVVLETDLVASLTLMHAHLPILITCSVICRC